MTENSGRSDVIYLHPAKQQVDFMSGNLRREYVSPFALLPVGVVGLANILRKEGLSVRGLNYPMECYIDPDFSLRSWLDTVGSPRLAMIDLHWYEHSFGALDVARVCKYMLPATHIVVGGLTASYYARGILEECPSVDYVIRGDAEEPLRRLAMLLHEGHVQAHDLETVPNLSFRMNGQIVENELGYRAASAELDGIDFVDTSFLDHGRRYLGFQFVGRRVAFDPRVEPRYLGYWLSIGRGCCYSCAFCGGGRESHDILADRHGLIMRSAEAVVSDIERLHNEGVHQVSLSLDPSIAGRDYWARLFAELSRRHIRIGLYDEAFQLPSPEFVEAFAESCDLQRSELSLSVLSGDDQVRQMNGKGYSNDELFGLLGTLKKCKIPVSIYFSFNLPGEGESSFRKTLALAERIGRYYPSNLVHMYNQPHTIDPCSPMSLDPDAFDISVSLRSFRDYLHYCRNTMVQPPGVLGTSGRGFRWRGWTEETERKKQQLWLDFCRRQRFLCF